MKVTKNVKTTLHVCISPRCAGGFKRSTKAAVVSPRPTKVSGKVIKKSKQTQKQKQKTKK